MANGIQRALVPHREWLAGLRWVDTFEVVLAGAGWLGALLAGAAVAVGTGWTPGMAAALGFATMPAAALVLARRHYNWLPLGLVVLAEFNLIIATITGWPNLILISYAIAGLGVLCLALAVWGATRAEHVWRKIADYRERDDFRWLVTQAPHYLRRRMPGLLKAIEG